jgi:hypothetical protein
VKKKFTKNYRTSNPNFVIELLKIIGLESGIRDPAEIRGKPIPDPGSKRHRITDPVPQD